MKNQHRFTMSVEHVIDGIPQSLGRIQRALVERGCSKSAAVILRNIQRGADTMDALAKPVNQCRSEALKSRQERSKAECAAAMAAVEARRMAMPK